MSHYDVLGIAADASIEEIELTGLAIGVLASVIRWPPAPVLGSALVGLLVSVPYGLVESTSSSMVAGAVIGGLVGWVVRWGD